MARVTKELKNDFIGNVESASRENAFLTVHSEHESELSAYGGYADSHPNFGAYVVGTAEGLLYPGRHDAENESYWSSYLPYGAKLSLKQIEALRKEALADIESRYTPRKTEVRRTR
jgi:hypothetical protein